MSNRKDFAYGQLVTQADLDEAFDYMENADHDMMVDLGFVGISQGLAVAAAGTPNLTVSVSTGRGIDQLGRRIFNPSTQVIDLAPYQPVGAGASKIVSIVARFDRELSSPFVDDNSVTVYQERAEAVTFVVVEGAEVVGVPTAPSKPADGLVLADVYLEDGDTQIVSGDIDTTTVGRRDWMFEISLGSLPDLQVGTLLEVVTDNRQILDSHISDLGYPHAAASIAFDNSSIGLPGAPDNIQDAVDELLQGSGGVQVQNSWTFDVPITIGSAQILFGAVDPSDGSGVAAPVGSLYLASDGTAGAAYIKTGTTNTAWSQVTV